MNEEIKLEYNLFIAKLKQSFLDHTGEALDEWVLTSNLENIHRTIVYEGNMSKLILYLAVAQLEQKEAKKRKNIDNVIVQFPKCGVNFMVHKSCVNPDNFIETQEKLKELELITYEVGPAIHHGYVMEELEDAYRIIRIDTLLKFLDGTTSAFDIAKKMLLTVTKEAVIIE